MPYIDRNQDGNIIGIYANAQRDNHEWVESAELWVAPPSTQEQIDQIETATKMNRASREGWLFTIERFAMQDYNADLPTVQAGLYAGNPAYKRIKDIDNQIVALRALI